MESLKKNRIYFLYRNINYLVYWNINLVYEGKNYNFDIPNNVTIDYLKELSSKIFNSDKALLDLVYKNKKFQINDENTLIRDLIPEGENNAILTVKINKNEKSPKMGGSFPLATLKSKKFENSEKKELKNINESLNLEKSNIKTIKNIKLYKEKNENKSMDKKDAKSGKLLKSNNKFCSRNIFMINNSKSINLINKDFDQKIFESTFFKKNKELLALMKEFNTKIKEVYLSLYKKCKNAGINNININNNNFSSLTNNSSISSNSNGINNNYFLELTIFEKKLIDFEDKQIKYYRRLLELIQKYYQNEDFLKLNEFFTNLFIFGINNYKDNTSESIRLIKLKKLLNNNNNNSSLGSSSSKNINKSLPPLNLKNNNSSMIFDKKNNSVNINNSNIYGINSAKNIDNNSTNRQMGSEDEKEKENSKNIINKDNGVKKLRIKRASLVVESKLSMNNINKDDNKNDDNSEKNSFEKNNINKPNPFPIRKVGTCNTLINLRTRKFSVINENDNDMNISEREMNNNGYGNKKLLNSNLRSSLNYRNSPMKERRIIIDPIKIRKKAMNEPLNENVLLSKRKITDINVSSMTVNDSNFNRDKKASPKKKTKKGINKYDFFM